ncbi:MAG: hypothetical protein IKA11_01660 [Clostridia bacterium]|nr:hypothetical protein [Clostridia bacterium]
MNTENSIILEILYNNKGSYENVHTTERYKQLLIDVEKYDREFRNKLSPELLQLYEKTNDTIELSFNELIDSYYEQGFKLGCLFGIELKK